MPENSEVLRSIVFTNAAFIFSKRDIQNPMQTILDTPMAANYMAKGFSV